MLGKKLKQLRVEKGCTLTEVADEVGVSVASMSKYEHNIHNPGDLILLRLAKYYGMTVEDLMEGSDRAEGPGKRVKGRLCPWRTKKVFDQGTGNEMVWFLPCMGNQCMAFEDDKCGMIRK